jgi:hypothetical protein
MNVNNNIPKKGMEWGRRDNRTLRFAGRYKMAFKKRTRKI